MKPQRSKFAALGVLTLLAIPGVTRVAHAAGIEDSVAGAVNLGRAANYVRGNDFMAVWQNPANLAIVPGAGNLGGELRFPLMHACFDRAKDNSVTTYRETSPAAFEHFGNVCNEGSLFPAGNIGFVQSRKTGWGWGLGFFTPAGSPTGKWGDATNVTVNPSPMEAYQPTLMGVESPTRYMLIEKRAIAGWLMAGFGAQPIPQLRFGFSAGAGFANVAYKNMASAQGGSFRDTQLVSDLHASDWVIPRMTTSIVVAPVESFEILGQLTYQADIEAEGYVDLTANGIRGAPRRSCSSVGPDGKPNPGPHCRIDGVSLVNPLPTLEATLGIRYAKRRVARKRVLNPLKDEVFDLELNFYWAQTSNIKSNPVTLYDGERGAPGSPFVAFNGAPNGLAVPTQTSFEIPRNWKDTYGVRFGGDYNVIADLLALRMGVSFETSAVPVSTMNIDFFPVQKIGLHAGLTLAHGKLSSTLAYSHIFFESVTVPVGTGKVIDIAAQAPERGQPVNEGYYQAAMDIISVQGNVAF